MASTSEWRLAGSFFKHRGHNIFWRDGGNPSGPVLLQKTPAPMLLIDGMVDPISGAHMVAHFGGLVPKAKVTELKEIGHCPQVRVPREVLAAYLSFRDEVDAHLAVTGGQRG